MNTPAHPIQRFFTGEAAHHGIGPDGQVIADRLPRALLPGSFNPVHAGHWGLARAAARLTGDAVDFELSVHNVDKPPLMAAAALERALQFAGRASLWLTRAPTFVEKARLFPGTLFVVGADTAARIVAPAYYPGGDEGILAALQTIAALGCRFLVAARVDAGGRLTGLEDLHIPTEGAALFHAIPPEEFRLDISSTLLRAGQE